jgi:hypothetical protein
MSPDFATPFIRGVAEGTLKLLPALLIVLGIMLATGVVVRRRRRRPRR